MPAEKWTGYERFCPFARGLDVIGERWTMVIVHELLGGGLRYSGLKDRLPGLSSNVLADRLRKLEAACVVSRSLGDPGDGVRYELTERGRGLGPVMAEIRRWGVAELVSIGDDAVRYDMAYTIPVDLALDEAYEWRIDDEVISLAIEEQTLTLTRGPSDDPALVLRTSHEFLEHWAAGERSWANGRRSGAVSIEGPEEAWDRMQIATNYPGRPTDLLSRLLNSQRGHESGHTDHNQRPTETNRALSADGPTATGERHDAR